MLGIEKFHELVSIITYSCFVIIEITVLWIKLGKFCQIYSNYFMTWPIKEIRIAVKEK